LSDSPEVLARSAATLTKTVVNGSSGTRLDGHLPLAGIALLELDDCRIDYMEVVDRKSYAVRRVSSNGWARRCRVRRCSDAAAIWT